MNLPASLYAVSEDDEIDKSFFYGILTEAYKHEAFENRRFSIAPNGEKQRVLTLINNFKYQNK